MAFVVTNETPRRMGCLYWLLFFFFFFFFFSVCISPAFSGAGDDSSSVQHNGAGKWQ